MTLAIKVDSMMTMPCMQTSNEDPFTCALDFSFGIRMFDLEKFDS